MSNQQSGQIVRRSGSQRFLSGLRRLRKPEVCKFYLDDLQKIYPTIPVMFADWKWVSVFDLMRALKEYPHGSQTRYWSAEELLMKFSLINKKEDGRGFMTWLSESSFALHVPKPPRGDLNPLSLYIPERWANLIIELFEQGIVELSARHDPRTESCFDIVATMSNGEKKWLHHQGGDGYKLEPIPWNLGAEISIS